VPVNDEAGLLLSYLRAQRQHVLGILDGLDDAALRRPVLPSGWSCLDMVSHLTHDIERFWFQAVVLGDADTITWMAQGNDVWNVSADVRPGDVVDAYRQAIERSDEIVAETALDAPPAWWPSELFGDFRLDDVREIILHVIVETACHAGHLDATRELLDGRRWLVLTD